MKPLYNPFNFLKKTVDYRPHNAGVRTVPHNVGGSYLFLTVIGVYITVEL